MFSKGDKPLELEIADVRLTTLETVARANSTRNRQLDERLDTLERQVQTLLQRTLTTSSHHLPNETVAVNTSEHTGNANMNSVATPNDDNARHMCDYCFAFAADCFACPRCGREWYCSAVCQRLRERSHRARCRVCSQQPPAVEPRCKPITAQ